MLAVHMAPRRLVLLIVVATALSGALAVIAPADSPADDSASADPAAPTRGVPTARPSASSGGAAPAKPAGSINDGSAAAVPATPNSARAGGAGRAELLEALGSEDRGRVERAVASLEETAPPGGDLDPDVAFAAARACEDRLDAPARALALYRRITVEHPSARVATAAERRAAALRE